MQARHSLFSVSGFFATVRQTQQCPRAARFVGIVVSRVKLAPRAP